MFSALEFKIAMRYLRSKRKEGFISVIAIFSFVGITLGVATLIIVMSVMNGFREELIDRILGINAHITLYDRSGKIYDYEEIVKEIAKINGIKTVNPLIEEQVMMNTPHNSVGGLVKAIDANDLKNKELIAENLLNVNLEEFKGKDGVIVGVDLADSLEVRKGDKIKLISSETNSTILGSIPRIKTYTVAGFFNSGMNEYDSTTIFMPIEAAQLHFRYKNSVSAIEVRVNDVEKVNEIFLEVSYLLQEMGHDNIALVDWEKANSSFIGALKVERNVMFIILTLIILVAAFNIISSLIMLVNDKNKNIALFRTMGATKGMIMRIFFICGSAVGVFGTICGSLVGILFATNIESIKKFLEGVFDTQLFDPTIYFLSQLPAKIMIGDITLVISMALVISFLATLYPSYKATKTNPAEILRYE